MAGGIIIHLEGDQTRDFPGADRAERIVDPSNRWNLPVGSLAVLKGAELQKAYKSSEWCWFERYLDSEPEPLKHVMVPRRSGQTTRVPGNRWQMVETVTDQRGPYHSWVIYRDKDIRAVFRHSEVALNRERWLQEVPA
jgi:hypothetical protein